MSFQPEIRRSMTRRLASAVAAVALLGTAMPALAQADRPGDDNDSRCYRNPQGKLVRDVIENGQTVIRACGKAAAARMTETGGGGGGISGLAIAGGAIVLGGVGIALAAQSRSGG